MFQYGVYLCLNDMCFQMLCIVWAHVYPLKSNGWEEKENKKVDVSTIKNIEHCIVKHLVYYIYQYYSLNAVVLTYILY